VKLINISALTIVTLILTYGTLQYGGVLRADWSACLLAFGLVSLIYWLRNRGSEFAPPLARHLKWMFLLFPCYVALQLVPLPEGLLMLLSPSRAELLAAMHSVFPGAAFAPLSATPSDTFMHFLRITGYITVCLLVREIAWHWERRPWLPAVPIIMLGALQASIGLAQYTMGARGGFAQGTYVNKNHFAGLLEMTLPFAVMGSAAAWRSVDSRRSLTFARAALAVAATAVAGLIFVAIVDSLSRSGFVASVCSLFVMGTLAVGTALRPWTRWLGMASLAILVALVFLLLPPDRWIARFADLFSSDNITANDRLALWRESTRLVADYPLFGCGLGAYQSAFLKYKISAPTVTDDYAHNDYLQLLAELGVIGFLLASALMLAIWREVFRAALQRFESVRRYLALACGGAVGAILIHSLTDFNLYIPANAMLLAWISGLCLGPACAISPTHRWRPRGVPQVLEVSARP
jgi:O-antigen ligase